VKGKLTIEIIVMSDTMVKEVVKGI